MADEKATTIEVAAEAESQNNEVKSMEQPTRDDMRAKGWSKEELDKAEKRGMLVKPEEKEKATADKAAADKLAADVKAKADADTKLKADGITDRRDGSSLPDFAMTPEQEKVFLATFPPGTPHRAFYFRAKNERQARQRIEAERDKLSLELQLRRDADVKRVEPEQEVDADGNLIDPDDKPLTMKQLKAAQKAEQDAANARQQELNERTGKAADALKDQEEYAKTVYPDFDATVNMATELVKNPDLIDNPMKLAKVKKLVRDLKAAAAEADKYGVDDYTASMIAYEIGQMHPKYGQKAEQNGDTVDKTKADPKADGEPKLTPEQMKRIEENTQRRASSASLPNGSNGRRVINVDDLTVKDVLRMTSEERYQLKKQHPDKMARLLRG